MPSWRELAHDFDGRLARVGALEKLRLAQRKALASDCALVLLGLRPATLLDCATLHLQDARALADALPAGMGVLYEPETEQTLICSLAELSQALKNAASVVYVDVSADQPVAIEMPSSVGALVNHLGGTTAAAAPTATTTRVVELSLEDADASPSAMITLAGIMLGYPISYATAPDGRARALDGQPLQLVRVTLGSEPPRDILAFSSPLDLHTAESGSIQQAVKAFEVAMREKARRLLGEEVEVHKTEVTLDRVAL